MLCAKPLPRLFPPLQQLSQSGLCKSLEGWFSKSGEDLRICISIKFPGDADAAEVGQHSENRCPGASTH